MHFLVAYTYEGHEEALSRFSLAEFFKMILVLVFWLVGFLIRWISLWPTCHFRCPITPYFPFFLGFVTFRFCYNSEFPWKSQIVWDYSCDFVESEVFVGCVGSHLKIISLWHLLWCWYIYIFIFYIFIFYIFIVLIIYLLYVYIVRSNSNKYLSL